MSRRCRLILLAVAFAALLSADEAALWREYGLVKSTVSQAGKLSLTTYEMTDPTGALAAWESLRSPSSTTCDLAPFCTASPDRVILSDYNYVVVVTGGKPSKGQADSILKSFKNKRESSLPGILTFLPRQGLVPQSARYVLGPVSLAAFAPELAYSKPGFESGAEAQVADYRIGNTQTPVHLALFYYPTPEMARLHSVEFKTLPGVHVKRSSILIAVVFGAANQSAADTLLSRVEYAAKITWNETPPPSPIKPLYRLLLNIIYLSGVLTALCLVAGLMYAGMRIYRRRYGNLEAEESMTTLRLTGD